MAKLDIILAPDPMLKAKARPVAEVDARVRRLMDDMLETMYAAPGIGLAAPQVGVLERIIVCDVSAKDEEEARPLRLVNPEVVWTSDETVLAEEGCLSLPEQYAEVTRPAACGIRYVDETGTPQEVEVDTILARCLLHELDHLEGVLFTDHLSALKRSMILRRVAKMKKARQQAA